MSNESIRVFDLEAKLAEDKDGSYQRSLADQLMTEIQDVKRQLSAGLPPDEYKQVSAYLVALEKGTETLQKLSKLYQSS
ncbi:hypothetical protein GC197_08950 [bacterium]|nr:hypothetical protein [bacterium]